MPTVVVEPSPEAIAAPEGGRLLDMCDEHRVAIPFSCRSASCGTCRVEVIEGAELLEPPSADETEVLDLFGDDPSRRRLACQARLVAGEGVVRLRPVDD